MFVPYKLNVGVISVALALAGTGLSARAALERVGAVPPLATNPEIGGFPAWYQDRTGLALEFCAPVNAELTDGWCLLGNLELPGGAPEAFPANFFDEHFYYAANALMTDAAAAKIGLVIAQEAAFASGAAQPNQQIVFSRLRVRYTAVPVSGNYRFMHPYGEVTIFAEQGERIFFTDDVGATCTGNFDCALTSSNLGPFLLPSAAPGGAEMGPVTAATPTPDANPANFPGGVPSAYPGTGKAYIADPARVGPVTGGTVRNFFRVEGPAGANLDGAGNNFIQTNNFSLMGRVFAGDIPGRVNIDRASYSNSAAARKLDVYATAVATQPSRMPGPVAAPARVTPTLSVHDQPCSGVPNPDGLGGILPPYGPPAVASTLTAMKAAGSLRWVQTQPASIPAGVCVRDSNARNAAGAVTTVYYPATVTDEVTVAQAVFDPNARTLSVNGGSSETVAALTLRLAYGADLPINLVNGQVVVNNLLVPPPSAEVQSSLLGVTRYQVSTGYATAPAAGFPIALNDAFTISMNTVAAPVGTQTWDVMANDTSAVGGALAVASAPTLGTASVAGGMINYTPNLNASGTDSFSYTVTTAGNQSNAATVTVNITPVNVAPVAADDTFTAIAGVTTSLNVLANDTDVNGSANIAAPANVSAVLGAPGATATVSGRNVSFRAPAAGNYTFTYRARDAGINGSPALDSNLATVTVQVAAAEVLATTQTQYERSKSRLRVNGTITPGMGQRILLEWVNAAGTAIGAIGTVTSNTAAIGNWALDTTIAAPAAAVSVRATPPNGVALNTAITFK